MDEVDTPKIADFGLSTVDTIESTRRGNSSRQVGGTMRWWAPEIMNGTEKKATKASDIYAFAMTCYEVRGSVLQISHSY